jgi:hypothetical protein
LTFAYGAHEQWLMEYLRLNEQITLAEFALQCKLPIWLASRKMVLLVLSRVLKIEPGENQDHYSLR